MPAAGYPLHEQTSSGAGEKKRGAHDGDTLPESILHPSSRFDRLLYLCRGIRRGGVSVPRLAAYFHSRMQILTGMEKKERKLHGFFRFDRPYDSFELLETESGTPGMSGRPRRSGTYTAPEPPQRFVSSSIRENEKRLREECRSEINPDVIYRKFRIGGSIEAMIVFMDGLADADMINDFVLKQGMNASLTAPTGDGLAELVIERVIAVQDAAPERDFDEAKRAILEGRSAVFLEGDDRAILMDTRGFPSRSVGEPKNETVVLGPHEAFTESIRTNISLIRRIVRTDDLVCEFREAGGKNNVRLAILYRDGIANRSLVNEVKRRLAGIDTLMVLSTGMIDQLAEEHGLSPVPQTLATERPDRAAAALMQGQVTVLFDGSPIASIMPVTLFALMSSPEDVYLRRAPATLMRVARYFGALLSILLPPAFAAIALHHQGMMSSEILATVIASRQMVHFPLALELIFMQILFQLIRQAGLSVPGALGQSVGIIGGLIMGQAAVAANIVSTVVLIVVALSGLGNFAIPDYRLQMSVFYFRLLLTLAAWAAGLLGLATMILCVLGWLVSLKSYGVPFLAPAAPKTNAPGPTVLRGTLKQHRRADDCLNTIGRERA